MTLQKYYEAIKYWREGNFIPYTVIKDKNDQVLGIRDSNYFYSDSDKALSFASALGIDVMGLERKEPDIENEKNAALHLLECILANADWKHTINSTIDILQSEKSIEKFRQIIIIMISKDVI